MEFKFDEFGRRSTIYSLDGFLKEIEADCSGFEHAITKIATKVVNGMDYLHSNGIAHPDLKSGNILISNVEFLQKYVKLQDLVSRCTVGGGGGGGGGEL